MFCYFLNIYFNEVLYDLEIKELKQKTALPNYILSFFNESTILRYALPNFNVKGDASFKDYCDTEINAINSNSKSKKIAYVAFDFKIESTDSWSGLFERMCSGIVFKDEKDSKTSIYISCNKYINDPKNLDELIRKDKKENMMLKNKSTLTNSFKNLKNDLSKKLREYKQKNPNDKKILKNYTDTIATLTEKIDEIDKINTDFRYFVITYGTDFVSEQNKDALLILQKYTVFPKKNASLNLRDQVFLSGKDNLSEGSYPDVIYFRPKIDFLKKVAAFANTVDSKQFHDGFISYNGNDKFSISANNSQTDIQKELQSIIEELDLVNNPQKLFSLTISHVQNGYVVNDNSNIFFTGSIISDIYSENNRGSISIPPLTTANSRGDENYKKITSVNVLKNYITSYMSKIANDYNFKQIEHIFKKSINVTQGDSSQAAFYSFSTLVDNFNYKLAKQNLPFEAELKILGEPAFTFTSSAAPAIYVEVNNVDGSRNNFLSGPYTIVKLKHDIDAQGGFTTTLTLKYITSANEAEGISNDLAPNELEKNIQ